MVISSSSLPFKDKMSSPRCPFVTILSPQQSPLTGRRKGANLRFSHLTEPWDLKASRNPVQSGLKHPLLPSRATTSPHLQKPKSLGGFRNSQQLFGLGRKTPGPKPALGRIKGSEELNSAIPRWMSDAAPQGAAPASPLFSLPGVLGRWQKLRCAPSTRDKERQRFPRAAPSPAAQHQDNSTQRVQEPLKAQINHTAGSPE